MVVVHFPVRIPPRWTALQHTFADRWPSLWLRVACASVPLYSFPMRFASLSTKRLQPIVILDASHTQ